MADTTAPAPAPAPGLRARPPRSAAPSASPLARKLPWNDKAGRFSPLKAITVALMPLPALYLLAAYLTVGLGPRPTIEAAHFLGRWTIWFLLITLAITPARRLLDLPKLIQIRRIVGLTALSYILIHVTVYIIDSGFNLGFVASEVVLRIYLTIGFVAVLGLILMGVTSTDNMVKRLGTTAWNRLHRIVYVVGFLGFVHYFLQSKADITEASVYSGLFFWLMGYRIMARLGWKDGLMPLVVLSVAAALLTALVEAAWYQGLRPGIGLRVLAANFDFANMLRPIEFRAFSWGGEFGVLLRPAWWVLIAGLTVTAVAEVRRRMGSARRPRPARA
jgi:sulfoxide reductase heme-binding subunit YedZ